MQKETSLKSTPIKKNQDYTIDITGLTSEGFGVGKIEGFTVFVEGALPFEQAEIKIIKTQKTYAFGRLIKILKASPERMTPPCPIAKRCGGCQLQHMDYQAQLRHKTQMVKDAIERIGGFKDVTVHDTIGMANPWRYRNKSQLPVGVDETGNIAIGFYASRTHQIIDTDCCHIQSEVSDAVSAIMREFIEKYSISVYDENTNKGLIRHIMTRKGFKTGEVMVCIVVNGTKLPYDKELIEVLKEKIEGLKSVVLNVNTKQTNVILGDRNILLYGQEAIYDYIGDFKFRISPLSFFQVNPQQTEVLYGKALEYAELTGNETVFDAYCGIGTISLFLSQKAKQVYGVEIVAPAIENAKENAKINGVENVAFICGESEQVIPEMYEKGVVADVVVVDPPRKGCDERLLNAIVRMAPERVVYVSCNPATLARDLKVLVSGGYEVGEVQPVDMFGWTGHVECVVRIYKR